MRTSLTFFAVFVSSVVGCGGSAVLAPPDDPGLTAGEDTGATIVEQEDSAPTKKQGGEDTGVVVEQQDSSPMDSGAVDTGVDAAPETPPAKPALVPSNGAQLGELRPSKLKLTTPSMAVFDTGADCAGTTVIGECTAVASTGDAPDVCVCRSEDLTIGGTLRVTGDRALALFAFDRVTITATGRIRANGQGSVSGPGATYKYSAAAAGRSGGAGGTFATTGGSSSVTPFGTKELIPLLGGMIGQNTSGGVGGGAGGAVQISAGSAILVAGEIHVGGGGGASAAAAGGAGGGSGGAVLLEAPKVEVTGTIAANGGAGAGGGAETSSSGTPGADAMSVSSPALGGSGASSGSGCPLYGYTRGGAGGVGATSTVSAGAGSNGVNVTGCIGGAVYGAQGGGGGGVGRIRINSASGCACSGALSPMASYGSVATK